MHRIIIQLRSRLLTVITAHLVEPFLRTICIAQKFEFTRETLLQLPAGTLGKELATRRTSRPTNLLPYYRRYGTRHMVLLHKTTNDNTISLQCFMPVYKAPSFAVTATLVYKMMTTQWICSEFNKHHWPEAVQIWDKSSPPLARYFISKQYLFNN